MKKSDIPFNMNSSIDPESLRDVPEDEKDMKKGIDFLKKELEGTNDELAKASLFTWIGVFSRLTGDLDESEDSHRKAIEIYKKNDKPIHQVSVELRLATTLCYQRKFSSADEIFEKTLKKMENSDDSNLQRYKDFALQHLGKSKFEQRQYGMAVDYLVQALEMRLMKGDVELIQSTEQAIEQARKKLDESE